MWGVQFLDCLWHLNSSLQVGLALGLNRNIANRPSKVVGDVASAQPIPHLLAEPPDPARAPGAALWATAQIGVKAW
jgi:hypothetical protein